MKASAIKKKGVVVQIVVCDDPKSERVQRQVRGWGKEACAVPVKIEFIKETNA